MAGSKVAKMDTFEVVMLVARWDTVKVARLDVERVVWKVVKKDVGEDNGWAEWKVSWKDGRMVDLLDDPTAQKLAAR